MRRTDKELISALVSLNKMVLLLFEREERLFERLEAMEKRIEEAHHGQA